MGQTKMSAKDFEAVPDVDIDEGVFKYVYIRVYQDAGGDDRNEKDIVRGYTFAEYHADVYDKTESELTKVGLDCDTMTCPASDFSSCFPSTLIKPFPADTFSSSGLYPEVSRDISIFESSLTIRIILLSLTPEIDMKSVSLKISSEDVSFDSPMLKLCSNIFLDSSKKFL